MVEAVRRERKRMGQYIHLPKRIEIDEDDIILKDNKVNYRLWRRNSFCGPSEQLMGQRCVHADNVYVDDSCSAYAGTERGIHW